MDEQRDRRAVDISLQQLEDAISGLRREGLDLSVVVALQRRLLAVLDRCTEMLEAVADRDASGGRRTHTAVEVEIPSEPQAAVPRPLIADSGETKKRPKPFVLRSRVPLVDYYRYVRVLFRNDEALLADMEQHISQAEGYADATDYLSQRLHWDPNEEEVTDFCTLLDDYFAS